MAELGYDDKGQGQVPNLYSSGSTSQAGSGAGAGGGEKEPSAAGAKSGWYNIIDFIKANKGDTSMQEGLQQKADSLVSGAKAGAEGAVGGYKSSGAVPSVFSADKLGAGADQAAASSGLGQKYQAQDVINPFQASQKSAQDALSGMKPGSFRSVADFGAQGMSNPAAYRPAQRAMDEALLMQDKDFVGKFAPGVKNQYEAAINPLYAQAQNLQGQENKLAADTDAARQSWFTGMGDFLKGKQESVNAKLLEQQSNKLAPINYDNSDPEKMDAPNNTLDFIPEAQRMDARQYGIDLTPYVSSNMTDPTEATAAGSALGQGGIDQYNALSGLLTQYGGEQYNPYSFADYSNPSYQFDQTGFSNALTAKKNYNQVGQQMADTGAQGRAAQEAADLKAKQDLINATNAAALAEKAGRKTTVVNPLSGISAPPPGRITANNPYTGRR